MFSNTLNINYQNVESKAIQQIQLKNINNSTIKNIEVDDFLPEQLVIDDVAAGIYFLNFKGTAINYSTRLLIMD